MAFNGSGTYVRSHNWATDTTNLVPVTASRMDTEDDGFATGLTSCIVKDGQQTTTARIPFALGTSSMAGSVSSASYSQTNDANTGVYFPATDEVALTAGGVKTVHSTSSVVTIPTGVTLKANTTPYDAFASGTVMLFQQTSAPTGWTKSSSHNDKALRIVSGSASSGGSTAFSSVFAARTIAQANLPNVNFTVTGSAASDGAHTHTAGGASTFFVQAAAQNRSTNVVAGTGDIGSGTIDSGGAHTHTVTGNAASGGSGTAMDFAVQYVDVIAAVKD